MGDPCTLADATGSADKWHIPSGFPWRNPWRNGEEQYPFGTVHIQQGNPWWKSGMSSGIYNTYTLSGDIFLPAAGLRFGYSDDRYGVMYMGEGSWAWTNTPNAYTTPAHHLTSVPDMLDPAISSGVMEHGMMIRCVKSNGLVHAAPGVIGIRDQSPMLSGDGDRDPNAAHQLTLQGSDLYANRPEPFVTASPFGALATEPVYVVYYKWGSTVAMIGEVAGINGEDSTFDVDDVVHRGNRTGGISNDYASFGPATPTGNVNAGLDNIPVNTTYGWDDPCVQLGYNTPRGKPWKSSTSINGTLTPFGT
jgi:hypothetical protein